MAKKKMTLKKKVDEQIFKIHLSLPGTEPLVWRRLLVPGHFTLEMLNSVFQLVMGWQMKHLYDVEIGGKRYSEPDDFDDEAVGDVKTPLAELAVVKSEFIYTYDFGDSWRHRVAVEEILPKDERFSYPACIGGENACPPEDCGGFPGYHELKMKISDSKNPEYDEMMMWLGGFFDPRSFDPNRINRDMLWMIDWNREPNDQGLYLPFNFEDEE
jgi:hypothetical protein